MSFFGELKKYLDADTLCRMYYCGDHEVFEFYKECDKDSLVSRREFPFLESLLLFLEMDHMSDYSLFFQIESDLISYPFYKEKQSAENALRELQELSKNHIYYEILHLACSQEIKRADYCPNQSLQELQHLLQFFQNSNMYIFHTTEFLETVLDVDRAGRSPQCQMRKKYEHDVGDDDYMFHFRPIPISYELVREGEIVPVLYSSNILELIDFALRTCVERGITVRRCKCCGRYFAQTGRVSAEYCSRPTAEGQKVCRESGAFQKWTMKQRDDPLYKAYRKEYKRRFAWIKAGRITSKAFYNWSKQVREKCNKCRQGQMTLEEFQAWLAIE